MIFDFNNEITYKNRNVLYNLNIHSYNCDYVPLSYYEISENNFLINILTKFTSVEYKKNFINDCFNTISNRRNSYNIHSDFFIKFTDIYLCYYKGTLYDINKEKSFIFNGNIHLYVNNILFSLCCKKYLLLKCLEQLPCKFDLNKFGKNNFILYVDKEYTKDKPYFNITNRKIFTPLKKEYTLEKKENILNFFNTTPFNTKLSYSLTTNKIECNNTIKNLFNIKEEEEKEIKVSPLTIEDCLSVLIDGEEKVLMTDEVEPKHLEWLNKILQNN